MNFIQLNTFTIHVYNQQCIIKALSLSRADATDSRMNQASQVGVSPTIF